jgi:amino acid adenylation domain-containing protein
MSGPTIHQLFHEQARTRPDAVAVRDAESLLTYRELDEWSDRIAVRLVDSGVVPGAPVAVAVHRSASYAAAVLGVLKAGGTYVPLDPDYPAGRREFIAADSGAAAVLVPPSTQDRCPGQVDLPARQEPAGREVDRTKLSAVGDPHGAYIVYTSGSTGTPKGVLVEHRQVVALVRDDPRLHVRPGESVALFAPLAFDASTFELWNTLCRGGELVVFHSGWDSVADLGAELRTHRPDWLFLTTGLFHLLAEYDVAALDAVGTLITGGDVLSPRYVRTAAARGTARVYAAYGPTETTTFASLHEVDPHADPVRVPIGRPLSGARMYVLDAAGQPVSDGGTGELYVGGAGVARGYLRAAASTAERFVPDPFVGVPGVRMYRTGDLARALSDGEFEFHGRVDRQVKIRGYRVEPGEVEAHLIGHPKVAAVAVTAVADATGLKRLVAYVTPSPGSGLRIPELAGWLTDRVPDYLEPARYLLLDALPLDANGKPDRSTLPYPWSRRADLPDLPPFRPPNNDAERTVAAVWADSLGVDQVGVDDDFYLLGGDSLHSVDVLARLRRSGLEVSALSFFRNPTVGALARAAVAAEGS